MNKWDPIGVRDEPDAQDEYDSYVLQIYYLLLHDSSIERIAEYILHIENKQMGFTNSDVSYFLQLAKELKTKVIIE